MRTWRLVRFEGEDALVVTQVDDNDEKLGLIDAKLVPEGTQADELFTPLVVK